MTTLRTLLSLLAACLALPAAALLTRADREDEEYRELATRYAALATFEGREGAGVLISPRWVLTTAHRASALADAKPVPRLAVGGRSHEISRVFLHPAWKGGADADLALLLLREASEVEPAPIYRRGDEAGKAVRIVAGGPTGRLGTRPVREGGGPVARAGVNTIDRLLPGLLEVRIKAPEEASDLQGALTPQETGAPAFVETEGKIEVAGIAQSLEDTNRDGLTGGHGDREYFVRVSAFAAWIDEAMGRAALEEAAKPGPADAKRR